LAWSNRHQSQLLDYRTGDGVGADSSSIWRKASGRRTMQRCLRRIPGTPAIEMLGNVIPFIGGEEEKVETEPLKIMGTVEGDGIRFADCRISAHTNRVFVEDGHMECVSVELERKARPDEVAHVLAQFSSLPQELKLPFAPKRPVIVTDERDRPQPRFDRDTGNGMSAVVGRIRECPVFDIRLVVLSHNTIRGAAGAAILNAELMKAQGFVKSSCTRAVLCGRPPRHIDSSQDWRPRGPPLTG
jgi:aspartate-semialdehyde dehydrogenase